MNSKQIIIFISLTLVCSDCYSRLKELPLKIKSSRQESSFFIFTAGYRMPVNKKRILNSGHGLYLEGGINPGKFISKNLVLGLYGGWAWMDRLWATSFTPQFASDYQSQVRNSESSASPLDSGIISSSADLIKNKSGRTPSLPGCEMNSFHNYSMYYGTVIKLPLRYAPTLKLYIGFTRSHFQGNGNIVTKNKDYNIFQLRRSLFGCEVVLFNGFQATNEKTKSKSAGVLSVYYECHDFYNSSLYFEDGEQKREIPVRKFSSESFLKKYNREVTFGFKVSLCIL